MRAYQTSPLNATLVDGRQRKALAIVGTSADPRHAPFDDPSVDVWGMNRSHRLFADREGRFRADAWFDLHEAVAQEAEDLAWFDACPVPLYVPEEPATVPCYPANEMLRRFPIERCLDQGRDYFACSAAYLLAFALALGYREVHLYGCAHAVGRELVVERACVSYWCGLLEGRGVRVVVHNVEPWDRLLTHPARYGLDYTAEKDAVHLICAEAALSVVKDAAGSVGGAEALEQRIAAGLPEEVV